jgi:hypothetical protein
VAAGGRACNLTTVHCGATKQNTSVKILHSGDAVFDLLGARYNCNIKG